MSRKAWRAEAMEVDEILLKELKKGPATVKELSSRLEARIRIRFERLRVRHLLAREGRRGPLSPAHLQTATRKRLSPDVLVFVTDYNFA
jgi:hypothetical protein